MYFVHSIMTGGGWGQQMHTAAEETEVLLMGAYFRGRCCIVKYVLRKSILCVLGNYCNDYLI